MFVPNLGIAAGIALTSIVALGLSSSDSPQDQGDYGLTDLELYNQIESGDPLGSMGFAEAANNDPRRIEGLLLQRIVQPLMFSIAKMQGPEVPMAQVRIATKSGYLQMMEERRARGPITAEVIARSMIAAWQKASEVILRSEQSGHVSAYMPIFKMIILSNIRDINRAFRESEQICKQAARVSTSAHEVSAYLQLEAILQSMQAAIQMFVQSAPKTAEVIDADIGFGETFGSNSIEREDLFGAYEFEEYLVSGHRAPGIGLSQYRRMGGRVF